MPRKAVKKGKTTKGKKDSAIKTLFDGLFYKERIESFGKDTWPFQGKLDTCNPHNLAISGFRNISEGEGENRLLNAMCVVCDAVIIDLNIHSDPWILHMAANKECALVKLGRPLVPDGYTMRNFLKLIPAKQAAKMNLECKEACGLIVNKLDQFKL